LKKAVPHKNKELSIDSIRPRNKILGPFLTQMGPNVAHIAKVAHNFLNFTFMQSIKHGDFNEDLKKLF